MDKKYTKSIKQDNPENSLKSNYFLEQKRTFFLVEIVSSQANIRNTFFNQRSPRPPEVGFFCRHRQTDTQTDRHGDSMTDPAQRAESVKITTNNGKEADKLGVS